MRKPKLFFTDESHHEEQVGPNLVSSEKHLLAHTD